ncbi:hypothetical protein ILUMI_13723 [Ignelater luminosus]|uniref:Uncharacterized protein n=1 Tax=Ignelater luminosus TaxID=2038154 RepID=A0A8K0D071_IGNLU|nr:hypothetical protein ILUMI_13723 [Ignelater luminosus]
MVKVGRLIKPDQQLCYAHGIQLAVVDVLYKQNYSLSEAFNKEMSVQNEAIDEGTDENHESDLANEELDNDEDGSFDLSFPTSGEINLDMQYVEVIKKVRKVVKLFKNSPTKNDLMQTYILMDMRKSIALLLDCKTRWSSLPK